MKIFKFEVDENYAREHNEFLANSRYFAASGVVLGLLVIAGTVFVYFGPGGRAIWALMVMLVGTALGLAFAAAGITAGKKAGRAQDMYDRYPLIPAVVAEKDDRRTGLLALVNTNVDSEIPPRWALTYTEVKKVPDGTKVGNQVPAAAVLGARSSREKSIWQNIEIMPISWGTPQQDVINAARKAIPHEQWTRLERGRKKLEDVKKTPDNMLVL